MAKKKSSWVVRAKCTIIKEIVCEDCTEAEARNNPFEFAVEEAEVEQEDCRVVSVEENI